MMQFKYLINFIKYCCPPLLVDILGGRRRRISCGRSFSTWDAAVFSSSGYDGKNIIDKVLDSTLKVKRGEAVFERDSVIFDKIHYSWPVTSGLMLAAAKNQGSLSVLDFGGSLGSSYFQNRKLLNQLNFVRWSVIEQENFVSVGKIEVEDIELKFYNSVEECIGFEKPNVILLSSVLQYLEDPYHLLSELMTIDVDLILIDRTPFLVSGLKDVIKVQTVPCEIYQASYPIRFFQQEKFMKFVNDAGFELIETFESLDNLDTSAKWRGMLLKRV
jgi:putative methyltransferase (TIGR04325 family)